jgi:hypothetical protein
MMVYRNRSYVGPRNALDECGPNMGEYPVNLVTRRTYSMQADALLDRREMAPGFVLATRRSGPLTWGDCGSGP